MGEVSGGEEMSPRDWIAAVGLALFALGAYMLAQQACLDSAVGCAAAFIFCGGALTFFAARLEFMLPIRKPERSCETCKHRGKGKWGIPDCLHPKVEGEELRSLNWQRSKYGKCGRYSVLWVARERGADSVPSAAETPRAN